MTRNGAKSPNGVRVLVAEDDASVRMTLEFLLEDEGFEAIFAVDGEEALRMAREHLPDLILLDHLMPKMDGKEVFIALRRDDATAQIPVLVLSGMGRDATGDWDGAVFLGKPFGPSELVEQMRVALA